MEILPQNQRFGMLQAPTTTTTTTSTSTSTTTTTRLSSFIRHQPEADNKDSISMMIPPSATTIARQAAPSILPFTAAAFFASPPPPLPMMMMKKRVRFNTAAGDSLIPRCLSSSSSFSTDNNDTEVPPIATWYSLDELERFKLESRRSLKCPSAANNQQKKKNVDDDSDSTSTSITSSEEEEEVDDPKVEGIGFCCRDRIRYSKLYIRCILSAYHKKRMHPQYISAIAQRCNIWSTEASRIFAAQTYCDIYAPHLLNTIPSVGKIPDFPFSMKKRKTTSTVDHQQQQSPVVVVQQQEQPPSSSQSSSNKRRRFI